MKIQKNIPLSAFTSFGTGGNAAQFVTVHDVQELHEHITSWQRPLWFLGSGANVLISDKGLPGTTLHLATSTIRKEDAYTYVADSGVQWDDLVKQTVTDNLWGLERTSGIPGSVGAAVVGNIAAYGQAISETLAWVEVIDTSTDNLRPQLLLPAELDFSYRYSKFQKREFRDYLILRAAFTLSDQPKSLEYASALKAAGDLDLDPNDIANRRTIIIEARRRAGSLLEPNAPAAKTAGSFFRNPLVNKKQAALLMESEEHNIPVADIQKQNLVHGGSMTRVSAAHVLLAAGFKRGQSWGDVRLHPEHVLKIENMGNASSQDIYNVSQKIIQTVHEKLGVTLEPEVRFLGDFR